MVPIIVILTVVVFLIVDLALRIALKKREEARLRRQRAAALEISLKLDFTDEAKSLQRVEVEKPAARILAVDDEPIVLDSFRKILVLAGYSVDTVETGPEALGLVRRHDYDFVFTDLKMPGMDGLDVTKAVKHLRPDIDVVIITGYATVESAVEAMKFGAMDYVQKPFTEDELVDFAAKLLIRRQARLADETPPTVHLVTATSGESSSERVINVPGGLFVDREHSWVGVDITGVARIGLDDFAHKTLGRIEDLGLPRIGAKVRRGEPLFSIRGDGRELVFTSPLSGRVAAIHEEIGDHLELLHRQPYRNGWICSLEPSDLSVDLERLTIGAAAIPWYEDEIRKYREALGRRPAREAGGALAEGETADSWAVFEELFLQVAQRAA